ATSPPESRPPMIAPIRAGIAQPPEPPSLPPRPRGGGGGGTHGEVGSVTSGVGRVSTNTSSSTGPSSLTSYHLPNVGRSLPVPAAAVSAAASHTHSGTWDPGSI